MHALAAKKIFFYFYFSCFWGVLLGTLVEQDQLYFIRTKALPLTQDQLAQLIPNVAEKNEFLGGSKINCRNIRFLLQPQPNIQLFKR